MMKQTSGYDEIEADGSHFACFDNGAAYHMVNDFWKHESTDAGVSTPAQVANRLKSKPFFD